MWIIHNSMEIHDSLHKRGRKLATYDFSNLYTSIPHDKLKEKLSYVIMKAFKGMNKKFIRVTNNSAKWSNDKGKGHLIDCDTLIAIIEWLIDNTFVTIGTVVFKQPLVFQWALTALLI